jgi:hypothetical protein
LVLSLSGVVMGRRPAAPRAVFRGWNAVTTFRHILEFAEQAVVHGNVTTEG